MKSTLPLALLIILAACSGEPPSIAPLRAFASSYSPCAKPNETCIGLPPVPKDVEAVLRSHPATPEYQAYVTLMMLKLYRGNLANYHQSYEVREAGNPILAAFVRFSAVSLKGDYVGSDIGYGWAKTQSGLLKDPMIAAEITEIEKQRKLIESGAPWK